MMDKVTQQNAANAEETASASEEMSARRPAEGRGGRLMETIGGNNGYTQRVATVRKWEIERNVAGDPVQETTGRVHYRKEHLTI
jgi:methyl-accepting chemotaxis protein